MMFKTKSFHSSIKPSDGLWILTSRFCGRGLQRTSYGASLRRWNAGEIVRKDYARAYTSELFLDGDRDARNRLWKKKILELQMNVQHQQSVQLARHLVSTPRFLPVNAVTVPGSDCLDGRKEIGELAEIRNRAALKTDILEQVKSRSLNVLPVTTWEKCGS